MNAVDLCQRRGDEGEALPQLERNQREADQRSQRLLLLTTDSACAPRLRIVVTTGLVQLTVFICARVRSRINLLTNSKCCITVKPLRITRALSIFTFTPWTSVMRSDSRSYLTSTLNLYISHLNPNVAEILLLVIPSES